MSTATETAEPNNNGSVASEASIGADFSGAPNPVNANLAAGSATTVSPGVGAFTSQAAMVDGVGGYSVTPVLTVGETLEGTTGALNESTAGDYTPVGILDGIGAFELDSETVRIFTNHELLNFLGSAYEVSDGAGGTFTLAGARVSYFDIDKETKEIVDGGIAYNTIRDANGDIATDASFLPEPFAPLFGGMPGDGSQLEGFSRFCSGQYVEAGQFGDGRGLSDAIYFAPEEDGGVFNSVGGAVWALNPDDGTMWQISAFGRGGWENVTEVDTGTTNNVAFILADDTSPFDADGDGEVEGAPLFLYVGEKQPGATLADGTSDFLAENGLREGKLFVWVPGDSGIDSPLEFNGSGTLGGSWVEVDNSVDLSQTSEDGSTGFDEFGYPTQSNLFSQAEDLGAFQFSRPEDVSTNPNDGSEFVMASTGVDTFDVDPATGNGADSFGTMYTMGIDFSDIDAPTGTLNILYDGDADPTRALRSPDNLDWADDGLIYVQEDEAEEETLSGDEVLFGEGAANPNEAGIVKIDPSTGTPERIANIDRNVVLDPSIANPADAVDMDAGDAGEWETSGILDVSELFGEDPGELFLFDVQAHGIEDQEEINPASRINDDDLVEGGQLAFLSAPSVDAFPNAEIQSLEGEDSVVGTAGDDTLIGDEGDNTLEGGAGADIIDGGPGDDLIAPGTGPDIADGDEGNDTASFFDIPFDTTADLTTGEASYVSGSGAPIVDEISNFENLTGSANNDRLTGDDGDNVLDGGPGNDTIIPNNGDDTIIGGPGNDTAVFRFSPFGVDASLGEGTAEVFGVLGDLGFIGEQSFETGFIFGGTEVGGLSGIEFNPEVGNFIAIADDRDFPQRFYTLELDLSEDGSVVGFEGVGFTGVTTITDFGPAVFGDGALDPESIRVGPSSEGDGLSLYWSSEGAVEDDSGFVGIDPFVREMTFAGTQLREFTLPEGFSPTEDGSSGIRDNLAFESLSFSPDQSFLFTATENALEQDGPTASLEDASPSRIIQFDAETGEAVAQFVYEVDPIPKAPVPEDSFADNGLVEMLAISDTQFLMLERSFAVGVGNTIKLFVADIEDATDVTGAAGIGPDVVPADKGLLFDLADLGIPLDNIEGASFGHELEDGRQTLVLVSDNNFNDAQSTLFVAFTIDGEIELIADANTLDGVENLVGTSEADTLVGDDANNLLSGLGGDDEISGEGGDDLLIGDGGNDTIDGGEGDDTAIFNGASSEFEVSVVAGEVTVTGGIDGINKLTNVETLRFSDTEIAVDDLPSALPNGVAAGDTDQTSSVLWARAAVPGVLLFELSTDPSFASDVESFVIDVTDPSVPAKVEVDGLDPATQYFYKATDADGNTNTGTFETPSELGENDGLSFGVTGDWRGELLPYPAISNADDSELDFFLQHGDTVYADFSSPAVPAPQATTLEEYRLKNEEVYSDLFGVNTLADVRSSTSIFTTIDDHEVTNDFAGGTTIAEQGPTDLGFDFGGAPDDLVNDSDLYENGIQAYFEYNPIADTTFDAPGNDLFDGEPNLFRSQNYGSDAQMIVLDQRSFRDIQLDGPDLTDPSTIPAFLDQSLSTEDRSILGELQFEMLKEELQAAEDAGITWKFVATPEPIQNIGFNSPDSWEGYANERAELLKFIDDNGIDNVVFVAADVHATFVNNVTYQDPEAGIGSPQIASSAFEVTTGSVAFEPPTGEGVIEFGIATGLFSEDEIALLETLPAAPDADDVPDDLDDFLTAALNDFGLAPFGFDPIGLDDNLPQAEGLIDAELLQGDYVSAFTFGWTQFDIDAETQELTVTTFGVPPYDEADIAADPQAILDREPEIVSQFRVTPQDLGSSDPDGPSDGDPGEPPVSGPATVAIYEIQGAGHVSPFLDQEVETLGIVTAIDSNGFYVQDPVGDGDDATSDGMFVFTSDEPAVAVGDEVRLTGTVSEFVPGDSEPDDDDGNLSITQMAFPDIEVLSGGNDLPASTVLGAGGRLPPTDVVISEGELPADGSQIDLRDADDAAANPFNPGTDGIDFYETLEGMRVTVENPSAVSATNGFGETWLVANEGADVTTPTDALNERGGINLNADADGFGDLNPERIQIQFDGGLIPDGFDAPDLTLGDELTDMTGVVSYAFGNFEVAVTEPFSVDEASPNTAETTDLDGLGDAELTVATYNILNVSPEDVDQIADLADQITGNLAAPEIIALQEVQDNNGSASATDDGVLDADVTLQALVDAIADAGGPNYSFVSAIVDEFGENGGVPGGNIRNAFLYDESRVTATGFETLESDVLASDFGLDDSEAGTGAFAFDGTRDPLLGEFEFAGEDIAIVNNHLTSRFGSSPIFGGPQPFVQAGEDAREAQTQALNDITDVLIAGGESEVIVLGDLNTFDFTDDLTEILPGTGDEQVLTNLITDALPGDEAYTFVFQGNSQVLDHIFVTDELLETAEADIVHVNNDFPAFTSDHEPVVAQFTIGGDGDTVADGDGDGDGDSGVVVADAGGLAELIATPDEADVALDTFLEPGGAVASEAVVTFEPAVAASSIASTDSLIDQGEIPTI
ncbi:MAG: esterase-like activity of phytase family protein [Geminicoccaceae bacterium]